MTALSNTPVVQSFLADHKKFMRLLKAVYLSVKTGKLKSARKLAVELDSVAGPHIAFEEAVLYPTIARMQDQPFVASLYGEHQQILAALATLIDLDELTGDQVENIRDSLSLGLEHADHCGTLISHLAAMDECDQRDALDELEQLRSQNIKWTELKKEN